MKGFKGFGRNMTCCGHKFKEGETYKYRGPLSQFHEGYNFSINPCHAAYFHDITEGEFAEVEAGGEVVTATNVITITNVMTIVKKLGLAGWIKACVEYLIQHAKSADIDAAAADEGAQLATSGCLSRLAAAGDGAQLATAGGWSRQAAAGDQTTQVATGIKARLAASGDWAQLAASDGWAQIAAAGDKASLAAAGARSRLAAVGDLAQVCALGDDSVVAAIGKNSVAKAQHGSWIVLAEWEERHASYFPKCVRAIKVDGDRIKADTWYKLKDGEFVQVELT